ncbi:PfWMP3_08 [Phormidium phage Pf-WMP3]|uniref:PfWMP3_08 n=1 Tax=Phormidium phage Pf-WMP3 TaxID=2914005 RepID=A5HL59_9CAUD|nr:PfWMP3_08 [Phormidium phage Pf-WMP3]ABQ12448.1 PfWMP3_08 [Phormidium phage Pf-WMP3]
MLTQVALHHLVDVVVDERARRVQAHSVIANLTKEEISTGVLSKQTMKRFKTRSPKLTKILPQELAELIGKLTRRTDIKVTTYKATKDTKFVYHQSDSKHYGSCMSSGAVPGGHVGCNRDRVDEDIEAYKLGYMHIAHIGEPWHVNQEGYISRSKLRVVYKDSSMSEVLGCAVETVYGDKELFDSNISTLVKWVKDNYGEHAQLFSASYYDNVDTKGSIQRTYIPSHRFGYQDTSTNVICTVVPYTPYDRFSHSVKQAFSNLHSDRRSGVLSAPLKEYLYISKGMLYSKYVNPKKPFRVDLYSSTKKEYAAELSRRAHELLTLFGFVKRNDKEGARYYRNGVLVSAIAYETYNNGIRVELDRLGYLAYYEGSSGSGFFHYDYNDKQTQAYQKEVGLTEDIRLSCPLPNGYVRNPYLSSFF